jgi:curved DNA-binding protein
VARDYYEVLGVSRGASAEELQRAYRTLARRNHPDVNKDPAAAERFREINEAYHVLVDPKQRERYDRYGPEFRRVPEDMDDRFQRAGAGRGRGSARPGGGGWAGAGADAGGYGRQRYQAGAVDLEDLFGDLFGGSAGPSGLAGADQEAELVLPLEEAYRGGRHSISLGERTYEVNIPAGVTDGQRIRLAGQGGRGRGGGGPGDLYLVVRIAPHHTFRLSGRDITVDLPVAAWEAALGASVPVPTPAGGGTVKVPPHTSSGRRLRLRGQGMPNPHGPSGDLYAEVKIMMPHQLSEQERERYEELAKVSSFDPRARSKR